MKDANRTSADAAYQTELKLDFTGLLGSSQVFAAGDDPRLQAQLVDANCNKIGGETCCGPPPPPPPPP